MRILLYTQNHQPGGGNRYFTDFINSIPDGHQIVVACNRGGLFRNDLDRIRPDAALAELDVDYLESRVRKRGNRLSRLFFRGMARFPFLRNQLDRYISHTNKRLFRRYFSQNKFDLAIAFNGGFPAALSCFDLLRCAAERKTATAMSIVSMPAAPGRPDKVYARTIAAIDRYIVNCKAIKTALSQRGIEPDKISVLYNCTALPEQENTLEATARNELRFGFVGRVETLKGAGLLIRAFADALHTDRNIRLTLYGKDMLGPDARSLITENSGKITLHGPFDDPADDVYPHIDVLILPSFWEGFPYVIIEAMSFGIPVIATDVGGISELLEDGRNGKLIQPRDPGQLRDAILYLSSHRAELPVMGAHARDDIKQNFTENSFRLSVKKFLSQS